MRRCARRIVTIASIAGTEGNPNAAAPSTSKAAVIALTESLGKELAATHVRVDAIAPAVFKRAQEIAAMIGWLAGEEASFSSGAVFDASGGRATY